MACHSGLHVESPTGAAGDFPVAAQGDDRGGGERAWTRSISTGCTHSAGVDFPRLGSITRWGVWVDAAITLTDTLPKGDYEMLGARALSATLVAARMNFKEHIERPAIIPNTTENYPTHSFNDWWGKPYRFTYPDNLPTVEILECTGSGTVQVEAYLRKVA